MSKLGVATHESGHGIVALGAFGRAIASLTIHADGGGAYRASAPLKMMPVADETAGFAGLCAGLSRHDTAWAEQQLIVMLAGAAAQERVDPPEEVRRAATIDRERAFAMAAAVTGTASDATSLIDRARLRADDLVTLYWSPITAVAAELYARGRLEEPGVWEILGRLAFGSELRTRAGRLEAGAAPTGPGRRWCRGSKVYYRGP